MNPLAAVRTALAAALGWTAGTLERAVAGLAGALDHARWLAATHRCDHDRVHRLHGDERRHLGPYRCRRCGRALRWLPPHSHVNEGGPL